MMPRYLRNVRSIERIKAILCDFYAVSRKEVVDIQRRRTEAFFSLRIESENQVNVTAIAFGAVETKFQLVIPQVKNAMFLTPTRSRLAIAAAAR